MLKSLGSAKNFSGLARCWLSACLLGSCWIGAASFMLCSPAAQADIQLPRLIGQGMVLQRDSVIPLWGWAANGETVSISLNGQPIGSTTINTTSKAGRWQINLPAQPAGGPYQIQISGHNQITLEDVYFGDLWVASGQSNMELPMARLAEAYPEDLSSANFPLIRQFTVPQHYNFQAPQLDVTEGDWQSASPATIQHFSALAYYFARELYQHNQVPIGILNNALGGSPVEAWLSESALQAFPDSLAEGLRYRDPQLIAAVTAADQAKNQAWYGDLKRRDPGLNPQHPWYSQQLNDQSWSEFIVPGFRPEPFTGVWWLRKHIKLSEAQATQATTLRLGSIVEADEVYLNGVQVGATTYQYPPRRYDIPSGILKAGDNLIALRITATNGKTGLYPDKPYWLGTDSDQIALTGAWKMQSAATATALPGDTFIRWKPLGLFNGLASPLTQLPVKGVIWYQGESNVGQYQQYKERFQAMIQDWRSHFKAADDKPLPFLYVQLANFLEKTPQPQDSSWAGLREAQRQSLSSPNTAMVVAIDTGEWNDIHPVDKKTLGQRLALAARAVVYGEQVIYRGPELASLQADGAALILNFEQIAAGLSLKGDAATINQSFAIAGADGKFQWAKVELVDKQPGHQLRLSHPDIKQPVQVRYAYTDNPNAVLYNSAGLPASPFVAVLSAVQP
jgi:sialate O-acetylesterase